MARSARRAAGAATAALLLGLLFAGPALVAAHGLLLQPASRNWNEYLQYSYYWSHGLNAGGKNAVSDNDAIKWPAGRMGMCGDPYNETRWDTPREVVATYMEGQVINVDFVIAVNHLGRVDMSICDLDAKSTSKCIQLKRAESGREFFYLPFVANWTGGNPGYQQPAYGDGGFSWYYMPQVKAEQGCRKQTLCNQFWNNIVYRTAWKLPANYSCSHCKLQWHYLTAHSCWPPCPDRSYGDVYCKNVQIYPECGTKGTTYPERFANCADVRIVSAASRTDAAAVDQQKNNLPLWSADVRNGTFGTPRAYKMGEVSWNRRRRRSLLQWLHLA